MTSPDFDKSALIAHEQRLGIKARDSRPGPLDNIAKGIMQTAVKSKGGKVEIEFLRPVKKLLLEPGQARGLADKLQFHGMSADGFSDSDRATQMNFKFE